MPWQERKVRGIYLCHQCPQVAHSGIVSPLPSSPFQTWHDNCCFASSLSVESNSRDVGAGVSHVTGWSLFRWPLLNGPHADTVNPTARTTITNQSPARPLLLLLPRHHTCRSPWPAVAPLMNQRHRSTNRPRQGLMSTSLRLPCCLFSLCLSLSLSVSCSLYICLSPLLHLSV